MLNSTDISKSKIEYIHQVKKTSEAYKHLVIYGAGRLAMPLYRHLSEAGIRISAFCVTDKTVNKKEEYNIPIIQIDELKFEKDLTLFLIGVKEKWSREVINNLKNNGFIHYINAPKNVEVFDTDSINQARRPVLEITPKVGCKIQCKYCPQDILYKKYFAVKDRTAFMSFDTFKTCIDKTPNDLIVSFAGFVEPFLNSDSTKMMLYATERGHDVSLYTTLVGVTKEIFYKIKDIPFLEVVLHTPDANNFANIPITEEYFEVLDMMLKAKKPNGEPFIDRANCQSVPHSKVLSHTKGRLRIFSELTDRAGNLTDGNLFKVSNNRGSIYCGLSEGLDRNILLPDGSMVLCCMDFGMQHILGNLIRESYEDIMSSNTMQDIKRCMLQNNGENLLCRNCCYAVEVKGN